VIGRGERKSVYINALSMASQNDEEFYEDDFHETDETRASLGLSGEAEESHPLALASAANEKDPLVPSILPAMGNTEPDAAGGSSAAAPVAALRVIPSVELELGRQLGGGAFAVIYAATWTRPLAQAPPLACAAKVLVDASETAAYFAELRALNSFGSHPNLLALLGTSNLPRPCFITELLGPTLAQTLRSRRWPPHCLCAWGAGLAKGVAHLHGLGIVHRDIKLSNIMIRGSSAAAAVGGTAVLGDFGLAGNREAAAGTPSHMAPELFRAGSVPTRAADVFAIGVVLWALFTGEEAWAGWKIPDLQKAVCSGVRLSWAAVRSDAPASLVQLAGSCWQEDPIKRPTAAVLAEQLSALAAADVARVEKGGGAATRGDGGDSLDALFSQKKSGAKKPASAPNK